MAIPGQAAVDVAKQLLRRQRATAVEPPTEWFGVKGGHHRRASGTELRQQTPVVAGRGLVADGMPEEAVLVLNVHHVVATRVLGDVSLEVGNITLCERPPEMRLQGVHVVPNTACIERPHKVATVRGNPTGTIPGGEVQYSHHARSLRCPPTTPSHYSPRTKRRGRSTRGGTVGGGRHDHNINQQASQSPGEQAKAALACGLG